MIRVLESRVLFPADPLSGTILGKLFAHMCLCLQAL